MNDGMRLPRNGQMRFDRREQQIPYVFFDNRSTTRIDAWIVTRRELPHKDHCRYAFNYFH